MRLTTEEKVFIARRAAGEFAIIPAVTRIVKAHKKNRNPDDRVFLEFARWAIKYDQPGSKSKTEDYLRLAVPVLDLIPEPYGTPWWKKEGAAVVEKKSKKKRKTTRKKDKRDESPGRKSPARSMLDLFGSD